MTYRSSKLLLVPARVVEVWGGPAWLDGDPEVSGWFTFRPPGVARHCLFELSDFRATCRYRPDLPDPQDFWRLTDPQRFLLESRGATKAEHALGQRWVLDQIEE